MSLNIWWIRRDLRLSDNTALRQALENGRQVLPCYILDEKILKNTAPRRKDFLFSGLKRLEEDLLRRGGRLIIRQGTPEDILRQLVSETGAETIYSEEDYSPYARRRDQTIGKVLPLKLVSGITVHPPQVSVKGDGSPYKIYTHFKRNWYSFPASIPDSWSPPDQFLFSSSAYSLPVPDAPLDSSFPAGETAAGERLISEFGSQIYSYHVNRDRLDVSGTSKISPYLHLGMISARQAVKWGMEMTEKAETEDARRGCETWINELVWREFYFSILYHFPHVLQTAFQPRLRDLAWNNSLHDLQCWQNGETGFPIVDAAMRQLMSTGWMHNRARMICASFLVKDLAINWQEGEDWFFNHLIDGDVASNNGGWQWCAGVGTDAAPYFRILNPVTQSQKFDPQGRFIREWVPELRRVPEPWIHTPWLMPDDVQTSTGCCIGKDYPAPIVDHKQAKERVLVIFQEQSRFRGTLLPDQQKHPRFFVG